MNTTFRGEGGFWVPNEVVDLVLPSCRPTGLALYCVLARCSSTKEYPNVDDLAEICLTTRNKVENLLDSLADMELLNYHDLLSIRGKHEVSPH